jgi:hypothetical protein
MLEQDTPIMCGEVPLLTNVLVTFFMDVKELQMETIISIQS